MLKITINSFSYKRGIPYDNTGNGGGFVFDCRGLNNPGRIEQYKQLTGNDKEVIDFINNEAASHIFINAIKNVIDVNIDNYIKRNFSDLSINFGCTGGQHRSVFCANAITHYIVQKYPQVSVELKHLELC